MPAAFRAASAFAVLAPLLFGSAAAAERVERPNVVVIFCDDLGYGDIGPFGTPIETPNLDRMAAEGRVFTDFYAAQAVCSASRAALLTGCYSNRVGILGALGPGAKTGINAEETTIAEMLKDRGYATAAFGKWHLGDAPKFMPTEHGFDEYFGLPYSNDMWPLHPDYVDLPPNAAKRKSHFPDLPLLAGNRETGVKVVDPEVTGDDQTHLTTWYTEHAVDFIDRHKDSPFFLYVPHSMPHVPLFVSEKFAGKSGRGMFGDVVQEIDWSVGEILGAIRRNGLDERTLVVFTSDNGPWLSYGDHAGTAGPLREGKGTSFDGGQREPTVFRWPGVIPAGTKCAEPCGTIDLLPTFAHLTGATLPEKTIDGLDVTPLLLGKEGAKSPHEALFFYWGQELQAVRSGRWKLHFPHEYRTLGGRPGGTGGRPVPYQQAKIGTELFDLDADPGESQDVAAEHPEVVARLEALAEAMRQELGDSRTKRQGAGVRPPGRL